jgi:16S rRNA processing protein RimM
MSSALSSVAVPSDLVPCGHIMGAYGVHGWVRIRPYSGDAGALRSARIWWLDKPEVHEIERLQVKLHSGDVVAQLQGIVGRDAAEAMKGTVVSISRSRFPALDDGEYYWSDLTGLQVVNLQGVLLGVVTGLIDNGAHPVLKVCGDWEGATERLIPFVGHYIGEVDLAGKKISVDWGLDY